jgi:hypothetical protein
MSVVARQASAFDSNTPQIVVFLLSNFYHSEVGAVLISNLFRLWSRLDINLESAEGITLREPESIVYWILSSELLILFGNL